MGTLWFWIVALMLAAYIVLDGFDLGVGAIYLFVARNESERVQTLRSIGPVWDGNEVWLLAAGGTLFFAFPLLYASAFSGFYLPLMMVLWLLILRGISVELRGHSDDPLWRTFFDGLFSFSSILLIVFFGAALGNVVRGVPIGPDDYFFLPLWTNWRTGPNPGILDWYTILGSILALAALSLHGALYLALKTEGHLERRALYFSRRIWIASVALTAIGIPATVFARPASLDNYRGHPIAFLVPLAVIACVITMRLTMAIKSRLPSFLASCGYLLAMLVGAATGLFPVLLPAVGTRGRDLTVARAIAGPHTLRVGLAWWSIGVCLALLYFGIVYWLFRGKVPTDAEGYGH
ncbi:cytochrome d ubiquinol oxidase subunit II [Silvibacterium bohemicum]|uniref:Cytochrome d ubiquinol oxidase subunit II n=1 Tax=Silvibacterium bohemicum TaxID=1577686 RepID=A0A841JT05_9BACT|nr:cytochrome d ubiquinol oxidase subunit II [Silvibacterium bohemicum]MBB6144456.1 cytochrome d ubiquinol oxidase subunit II [Silvibacterium bohemicum]